MRLINADELRAKAIADCPSCALNGSRHCRESCNVNNILELIDDAPTVDAIPNAEGYEMYNKGYVQGYERGKEEGKK